MALCGPSCAIPSCASTPSIGFGSTGVEVLAPRSLGLSPFPSAETSGSLGTLAGIVPSCINQIPASEVTIQPAPIVITIPGPILSASCEPVTVGGNTPCAAAGFGPGLPTGLLGAGLPGPRTGRRYNFVGERGSICYSPC